MSRYSAHDKTRSVWHASMLAGALSAGTLAPTGAAACEDPGALCVTLDNGQVYTEAQGLSTAGQNDQEPAHNGSNVEMDAQGAIFNLDPAASGGTANDWRGVMYMQSTGGSGHDDNAAGSGGAVTMTSGSEVNLVVGNGSPQTAAVMFAQSIGGSGSTDNKNNDSNGGNGGGAGPVQVTISAQADFHVAGVISQDMSGVFANATGGTGGHQNSGAIDDQRGGTGGAGGLVAVSNSGSLIFMGDSIAGGGSGALQITNGSMVSALRAESKSGAGGQYNGNAGTAGSVTVEHTGGLLKIAAEADSGSSVYGIRALSEGAAGFDSQDDSDPGGSGGTGGPVTVNVSSDIDIDVSGASGAAILARSAGGQGGKGPEGNTGGTGGQAGAVEVHLLAPTTQAGYTLSTTGDSTFGVLAMSRGGFGGDGDSAGGVVGEAGGGGVGGKAGTVNVTTDAGASIVTSGHFSSGVVAWSLGGGGGAGGDFVDVLGGAGGNGGQGGDAGAVTVNQAGHIVTSGDFAYGLDAQSISGGGGAGGVADGLVVQVGGDGGIGGNTGTVTVTNTGTIQTSGYGASGIVAMSVAGGGGNAGAAGGAISVGGNPGSQVETSGAGVTVQNLGTITTSGDAAVGISAQSIGGGGGNAGGSAGIFSVGGQGAAGGNGGTLDFAGELGAITTAGAFSYGILAQSIGGGGGNGGDVLDVDAGVAFGIGGAGGAAGNGGDILFSGAAPATIQTGGLHAHGILAQSIGGGGGAGGAVASAGLNALTMSVGGSGSHGGSGGHVNFGWQNLDIRTAGSGARGIMLQSIGGGGGAGGGVRADSVALGLSISADVGGKGGAGGAGGDISATIGSSSIATGSADASGSDAVGILAQSIGGGGGSGGNVVDQGLILGLPIPVDEETSVDIDLGVAVGGSGGSGSGAGQVQLTVSDTDVTTYGQFSHGIYAQSVGGGGGDGGSASIYSLAAADDATSVNLQAVAAVGGQCRSGSQCAGGDGGGAAVTLGSSATPVTASTLLATHGDYSHGVLVQSVGGGGGDGGTADTYAFSLDTTLNLNAAVQVGGQGGSGGHGGASQATAYYDAAIVTDGAGSKGILAQSIGGGGGTGQGTSASLGASGSVGDVKLPSASVSVGVGMTGGTGGTGGAASVANYGLVQTSGRDGDGIVVQSIGGGGGLGGSMGADDGDTLDVVSNAIRTLNAREQQYSPVAFSGSLNVQVGGKGGSGGVGGSASATHYGSILTSGDYADGIVVQSIGGGGGAGGASTSGTSIQSVAANVSVGGAGGSGGTGGAVEIWLADQSVVQTQGYAAYGVLGQSIGGGGGQGGTGTLATRAIVSIGAGIGGGGGEGSAGGTVKFTSRQDTGNSGGVYTYGDQAHGVVLQSIGGGGGAGGTAQGGGGETSMLTFQADLLVGGAGGNGGDGGTVGVCSDGNCAATRIQTVGDYATGMLAQSIGGGGGLGGLGDPARTKAGANYSVDLSVGGAGGDGGTGGLASVQGQYLIATYGDFSAGVIVQSIGGGGGLASSASSTSLAQVHKGVYSLTLGGSAGAGGDGGGVSVSTGGQTATHGDWSHALVAQSIGGGGGIAGTSLHQEPLAAAPLDEIAHAVMVGGGQGSDRVSGSSVNPDSHAAVSVMSNGKLLTQGRWSVGLLAQSIGGGGGTGHGGLAANPSGTCAPGSSGSGCLGSKISVGAGGNASGNGAAVDVTLQANEGSGIQTAAAGAYGVLAQSIGAGGGLGTGVAADSAVAIQVGGWINPQASDSVGGNGGVIDLQAQAQSVYTAGADSAGLVAQSIGGGGGVGGVLALDGHDLTDLDMVVGGALEGVGNGVTLSTDQGLVVATQGERAYGVVAQSIGGGGGIGVAGAPTGVVDVQLGGSHASATPGSGGQIDLQADGIIQTAGAGADGLVVQSIGGGGGLAGVAGGPASVGSTTLTLGSIAASGNGGAIGTASDPARIAAHVSTDGDFADGVVVQSIGGGGGLGGIFAAAPGSSDTTVQLGGADQAAASAGGAITLVLDDSNDGSSSNTAGYGAHAMVLQSIGGGGGMATAGPATMTNIHVGNGWGDGGSIDMLAASWAALSTAGDDAHALIAQSIGGGGGIVTMAAGNAASSVNLALNGAEGNSGSGGTVTLNTGGMIQTAGARSIGIIAQSIGGGGGLATAGPADTLDSIVLGYNSPAVGHGAAVAVTLSNGTLHTHGAGAHGIVAQSIGGGGGIVGDISQAINPNSSGVASSTGNVDGGNGGTVAVAIQSGFQVRVDGANAIGVVAQSIGGSGGLSGFLDGGFAGTTSPGTSGGAVSDDVTVTVDGTVAATGDGGIGILAQSVGPGGTGSIKVNVNNTVQGGSGDGVGIWVMNGNANVVDIQEGALVSALSNTAVRYDPYATSVSPIVSNAGQVAGDVVMSADAAVAPSAYATLDNRRTGVLSDALLYQAHVDNAGLLQVGRSGRYDRLTVAGDFSQSDSGVLRSEVDFAQMRAARMVVQGDARLGGVVDAAPVSLLPGRELTVLRVEGAASGMPEAYDSPVFDYDLRKAGQDYRISVGGADFNATAMGLEGNQSRIADHLQHSWDAGGSAALAPLFASLDQASRQGGSAYSDRLSDLSPGVTLAPAAQMAAGMTRFTSNMMSCPAMDGGDTQGRERDCVWGQASTRRTDQDAHDGYSGFSYNSTTYQAGGQFEFRPDWFIGASVAYQNSHLRGSDGRASGSGDAGYVGVVLKRQAGPWVFSGSLGGGYASYDMERNLAIAGYEPSASSSPDVYSLGARLRAARHIGLNRQLYLKPYVDLDMLYTRMSGYTESGDALSLEVDGSDQFLFALSPMLEFGGRVDLPEGATLRPYAYAGASFLSDDSWNTDVRLSGAPGAAGTFNAALPGDSVIGRFGVGMQVNTRSGLDFRLQYDGEASSKATSHAGQLKVMYRF